ncbi:MAG: hypothetical protein Q9170_000561 [Blastenia crenularia]
MSGYKGKYISEEFCPTKLCSRNSDACQYLPAGQRSTFPKLLFIENRMKIERLIEGGLLFAGDSNLSDRSGQVVAGPYTNGSVMRTSAASAADSSSVYEPSPAQMVDRRSSMLDELRRQSGVFFDDLDGDGDDTDVSVDGVNIDADTESP